MNIICPQCTHSFLLNDAIDKEKMEEFRKEISKEQQKEIEKEKAILHEKMDLYLKQKDADAIAALHQFKEQMKAEEQASVAKMQMDIEVKMKFLQDQNEAKDARLQVAQKKEIEFLHLQNTVMEITKNAEMDKQKALLENTAVVREQLEKELVPKLMEAKDLALKQKDIQLESMNKKIEELQKKGEQGSMQTQGEALELMLEALLRGAFPFDDITEVAKGVRGADCLQTVRNKTGAACGTILFESKRTKNFENDWIEKLKVDARNTQADIAVIVTQVLPKDIKVFGQKDGVWICTFSQVAALVSALRSGIIKVAETKIGEENKGEKMVMLYHFLTSNEFMQHIEAMLEGYTSLREGIVKERMQMEKMWKEREKQLDKVLLNTSGMWGSIKGIAGGQMGHIQLLDGNIDIK